MLFVAVLLGTFLRLAPVLVSGFPVNDGGMFYTIVQDLLHNHFRLPVTTTYNLLNLPLAYPPFGFYLAAGLTALGLDPLQTILWLPPLAGAVSILLVFRLARIITDNMLLASLAALLYALVPTSATWLLMGGGLTRAPAFCWLLLTLSGGYRLFLRAERSAIWETSLAGALTVLSHPEMSLHAAALVGLFFLFRPSRQNLRLGLAALGGVLALSAPWWGFVISQWGLAPFLNAPQAGLYSLPWAIYQLGSLQMVSEAPFSVVALAGLLGLILALTRREWRLPLMLCLPYLVNPRNANTVALVPLTILAAQALLTVIVPALGAASINKKLQVALAAYLMLAMIVGTYANLLSFSQTRLTPALRQGMAWVKTNTPAESRFLVISGSELWSADPVREWFPALAERHNLSTIQGREWLPGTDFFEYAAHMQHIQACYWQDAACLEQASQGLPVFDYLFIPKQCTGALDCTGSQAKQTSPLYLALTRLTWTVVYEDEYLAIFAMTRP